VAAGERVVGWPPAPRRRTVLRLDGGFGTDAHLNWALWHGDQGRAQGARGRRAKAFARAVPPWEALRPGARWMAPAPGPRRDDRRTPTAVLRWQPAQDTDRHRLLIPSWMEHSLAALAEADDDRAAIEAALQADTGGLPRHRRRQQRLAAQEALGLLTDVAHHRLAWTREWICRDSPVAAAGIHRMVTELLPIPGNVVLEEGQIVKLRLKPSHPLAKPMLVCLARLCERVGTPGILRKS
jgi:hypothetical protein